MSQSRTLRLYGTHSAKKQAALILENEPHVKRILFDSESSQIKLILSQNISELELIQRLEASGLTGFQLLDN